MRRARPRGRRADWSQTRRADRVSWILAFPGFAVLIVLHEAGHFAAAKAVGMRVERFFLFFPPKLWSVKRGETEYGIGAIPLGGFVKITGMNPEEELDAPEVRGPAGRATTRPARLEADRRDRGGAVREPRDRLRDPLLPRASASPSPTQRRSRASQKGTPAAAVLEPGDQLVAVDGVSAATSRRCATQIATPRVRRRADRRLPGRRPRRRSSVLRDGERGHRRRSTPVYDAAAERPLLGFALRNAAARPGGRRRRRLGASTGCGT